MKSGRNVKNDLVYGYSVWPLYKIDYNNEKLKSRDELVVFYFSQFLHRFEKLKNKIWFYQSKVLFEKFSKILKYLFHVI